MTHRVLALLWSLALLAPTLATAQDTWVTIAAGDGARQSCPVLLELPAGLPEAAVYELSPDGEEDSLLAQAVDRQHAYVIVDALQAEAKQTYRVRPVDPTKTDSPRVQLSAQDGGITITVEGRPVLKYHTAVSQPPAGMNPLYARSGHIHPVWTPQGKIVTEEFPIDHGHQHAVFNAWVSTEFEGRHVDFWNQAEGTGTVEHRSVESMTSGPVFGELKVRLAHVDLSAPEGPKDALHETQTIRVFATDNGHLFEIESVQTTAGESPLKLLKYHYGGMAVRGNQQWKGQSAHDFLTSEGLHRANGNHTRANWVSIFGETDGQLCSLTMFSDPGNFRAPQPVRLHPDMPYFVFSPPVLGEFSIEPGNAYVARYRFFVADVGADAEQFNTVWENYTAPPEVSWERR